MAERKNARLFEHPVAFGSFRSWLKLLMENRDVDAKYLPRVASVTLSTLLTSPFKLYESARYSGAVKRQQLHPSPVFIIGHWRTGTTHLHNLLCQDPSNSYVSTFQAFAPGLCLTGEKTIKEPFNRLARKFHPTREIDNIPLSMDNPEEEDLAIANMSGLSYLHMYTFPRRARHYFETYVTNFRDLPQASKDRWRELYLTMLRKASLVAGGRRLVIKNCADSARIPALLEMFPDARFIHTCRNPYDVFRGTQYLYWTVLQRSQLQEFSPEALDEWVIQFYAQLMNRFFEDRSQIPDGNIVDVKYEDLVKEPIRELSRVYETLRLPAFEEAEPRFRHYLDSIARYSKNVHPPVENIVNLVNEHWGFAFDRLGYERVEPSGSPEKSRAG